MIFMLIHWRIKPTHEAETQFLQFWTEHVKIADKTQLVGEFLSTPLPAHEFPFLVDDWSHGQSHHPCRHFLNIGIWQSWEAFYAQVHSYLDDDQPLLPFEVERRTRTVLTPKQWRIGLSDLPAVGSCE